MCLHRLSCQHSGSRRWLLEDGALFKQPFLASGCKQLPACGRCCCRLTRTRLTRWTRQTHGSGATTLSRAAHVRAARPAPSATCAAPAG